MGMPWVHSLRKLHWAVMGLTLSVCLTYLVYVTVPGVQALSVPMAPPPAHSSPNETSSPQPNRNAPPSELPAPGAIVALAPNATNTTNSGPDLSKGVAAEALYEEGHTAYPTSVCPGYGKDLEVLIMVTSAPSHEEARHAIRYTWGHYTQRRDVELLFMLGTTAEPSLAERIKKEQYLYGDIIQGNFVDTYDNLTLKTISFLEFVSNNCSQANFVLKTDDDMFINVPQLLSFIKRHNAESRTIYGRLAKKWKPIRNIKSKYYISPKQYHPAVFPDFTTGPAYLFPARLAKSLYVASLNYTYFKLEDVFVTGIVANGLKIHRVHAPEFFNKRVSLTPCNVQRGISIHMVKGVEQFEIWKKLLDGRAKCNHN